MNSIARKFEVKPAVRESVPLLVGLQGPSGGGKTFSALRLARGIQAVTGGDIFGIDTEARRMLHYADLFKFRHMQFDAPFGSLDYLAAIQQCAAEGGRVIIVDSMSHEHEGTGGLIDMHDQEVTRMAGDDYAKRDRVKMLAWQKPKADRRKLISGILQMNANFIFCFRAKETAKPMKNAQSGKNEVVQLGFMPIAGDEFVYEQTVNCLLLPGAKGVPTWRSDNVGERAMMKLPEQFKDIFANQVALSEDIGTALASWARGETIDSAGLLAAARAAAKGGKDGLQSHWKGLDKAQRTILNQIMSELKATAEAAAPTIETQGDAPPTPTATTATTATTPDVLAAARRLGADWHAKGGSRKALPPELKSEDRRAEADAWCEGFDEAEMSAAPDDASEGD